MSNLFYSTFMEEGKWIRKPLQITGSVPGPKPRGMGRGSTGGGGVNGWIDGLSVAGGSSLGPTRQALAAGQL